MPTAPHDDVEPMLSAERECSRDILVIGTPCDDRRTALDRGVPHASCGVVVVVCRSQ
jgi:hypothetical protein